MEKQLSIVGYWLGLVSLILAVILRLLTAIGVSLWSSSSAGNPISYMTFLHGAEVFLLLSIASSGLAWFKLPRS